MKWLCTFLRTLNEEEAERRLEEQDGDDDGMITLEEYVKAVYDHDLKELEKLEKEENEDTKYIQEVIFRNHVYIWFCCGLIFFYFLEYIVDSGPIYLFVYLFDGLLIIIHFWCV